MKAGNKMSSDLYRLIIYLNKVSLLLSRFPDEIDIGVWGSADSHTGPIVVPTAVRCYLDRGLQNHKSHLAGFPLLVLKLSVLALLLMLFGLFVGQRGRD